MKFSTRIMIVDDEEMICESLQAWFVKDGYQVETAEFPLLALERWRKAPERVDLVITDIIMPVKDGITTIQDIQKDFPAVKIIAISGGGAVNQGSVYLEAAIFITRIKHVLEKPFSSETLLQTVKEVLE